MKLLRASVGPFRSINEVQTVEMESSVTVFVGMNEAGKTVFLQALEKSADVRNIAVFNPVDDYPRKDLSNYLKQHKTEPAEVVRLTYRLDKEEVRMVNDTFKTEIQPGFQFTVNHKFDNKSTIAISISEAAVIKALANTVDLSSDAKSAILQARSIRKIPDLLKGISPTEEDSAFLVSLAARIAKAPSGWSSIAEFEVWGWLSPRIPKFLYFSDYDLLPSKINLVDLAARVAQSKSDPKSLKPQHRALLALLRMADIAVEDFTGSGGYEQLKAKIEGVSISLTDQIMEFWKQNEDLEVEVDIKDDLSDEAPFNNGPNLYLRIKNRRHRGVSTPFQQRSRGFIWFFSFLVWFDSIQHQITADDSSIPHDVILLLDEPGLALHALAQADFLNYIDNLSNKHQVLYTTHSPFMVHSDRLHQVRVVEDRKTAGTVVSDNVDGSDPRTIFPLQAALGWTLAQNLFISDRNLLVEGASELIYFKTLSALLEKKGKVGLRDDVTIMPVGGLDKVVTFIALLGGNGLKMVVFHDYKGSAEQKLAEMVKNKIITAKILLNPSQFRDLTKIGINGKASDTEDLFSPAFYLEKFCACFSKELASLVIKETDLPPGDRIVNRIDRYLKDKDISIRPSGGFNHYAVASHMASSGINSIDAKTLQRFEALFGAINALF